MRLPNDPIEWLEEIACVSVFLFLFLSQPIRSATPFSVSSSIRVSTRLICKVVQTAFAERISISYRFDIIFIGCVV